MAASSEPFPNITDDLVQIDLTHEPPLPPPSLPPHSSPPSLPPPSPPPSPPQSVAKAAERYPRLTDILWLGGGGMAGGRVVEGAGAAPRRRRKKKHGSLHRSGGATSGDESSGGEVECGRVAATSPLLARLLASPLPTRAPSANATTALSIWPRSASAHTLIGDPLAEDTPSAPSASPSTSPRGGHHDGVTHGGHHDRHRDRASAEYMEAVMAAEAEAAEAPKRRVSFDNCMDKFPTRLPAASEDGGLDPVMMRKQLKAQRKLIAKQANQISSLIESELSRAASAAVSCANHEPFCCGDKHVNK